MSNSRGEASAREMASDYTQKARESLERVGGEQEFLVELISYMLTRVKVDGGRDKS